MTNPYATPKSDINMSHSGSVDTSKPYSPKGRSSRLSFFAWNLIANVLIGVIVIVIFVLFGGMSYMMAGGGSDPKVYGPVVGIFVVLFALAFLLFSFVLYIRRLHDIDMSGWWCVLVLIPLVNIIFSLYVMIKKGTEGNNNYGPPRPTPQWEKVLGIIALILLALNLVGIIATVFISGINA